MSSPPTNHEGHDSTPLSKHQLPTFNPVRDHSQGLYDVGSSASGSRRSGSSIMGNDHEIEHEQNRDGLSLRSSGGVDKTGDNDQVIKRRPRPHGSGGFLLDSLAHPSRISRASQSSPTASNEDRKGKRKSTESDILIQKRRSQTSRYDRRASLTGSPLATEVKHEEDLSTETQAGEVVAEKGILPAQHNLRYSSGFDHDAGGTRARLAGFETDPAQIVNMALTLNAARQRRALATRNVSNDIGVRRAVSGAQSARKVSKPSYASPYSSPQQQRMSIGNTSFQEQDSNVNEDTAQTGQALNGDSAITGPVIEELAVPTSEISRPTASRVKKAKTYFELASEHRRLLSHLPPVRRPGTYILPDQSQSKIYNPLQYVRNRKLRFAEGHPLLAETAGWHDIDQVRAWVDAVVESHKETRHDPNECVRLPELNHHAIEQDLEDENNTFQRDSPATSVRRMSVGQPLKPRRPRSDWVTHPGDLIADAFWLEQGLNKTKILDRHGNRIYPPDTHFKFSGWRNMTPNDMPVMPQEPTPEATPEAEMKPEAEDKPILTTPPSAVPELPVFASADPDNKKTKRGRHRIDKIRDSINTVPEKRTSSSRRKKQIEDDSLSSSDEMSREDSDEEASFRGRRLISRKRQKPAQKSEEHLNVKTEAQPNFGKQDREHHYGQKLTPDSKNSSVVDTKLARFFTRESTKTDSLHKHSKSRSDSGRRNSQLTGPRDSFEDDARPRNSAEYDTTTPSSPVTSGFPSIAINLSPPASRSPSPTKKSSLPAILHPFRDRSRDKQRHGIEETDFAEAEAKPEIQQSSSDADKNEESSNPVSRGTSPMTRGTSPMTKLKPVVSLQDESPLSASDHRGSTISRVSTKSATTDHSSKIRGIFKGGRIAELVGNEVSRVGDYIWKRDVPAPYRAKMAYSAGSLDSDTATDTDEETKINGSVLKTPPPQHKQGFPFGDNATSDSTSPTFSHSSPESAENRQYHNPNLPTFTSPFQQDRYKQEEKKRAETAALDDNEDHISRLAAEHRTAAKSPRLDRLAPPKLAITQAPISSPSTGLERRDSYGFGNALNRSQNPSQIFDNALKTNGTMVTGLTAVDPSRPGGDFEQLTRYETYEPEDTKPTTESLKRDIARTTTLIHSQIVKAREISLRSNTVRDPVPKFVLDSMDPATRARHSIKPFRIPRKEEHVFAARNIISSLTTQATAFHTKMDKFSTITVPALYTNLQTLEDEVDTQLVPRVRKAVDEVVELTMKLTTTTTLAVKGLNDTIDGAFRRRRRGPVRWLRRFGYVLIEWVVVGLLWMIWLVVTSVRFLGHVLGAFWWFIRWLFWLV